MLTALALYNFIQREQSLQNVCVHQCINDEYKQYERNNSLKKNRS